MNIPKLSLRSCFCLAAMITLLLAPFVRADDGNVPVVKIAPDMDLNTFTCTNVTLAVDKDGDTSVLSVKIPANQPGPRLSVGPASGTWDFSAAKGIRVLMTNKSDAPIPITLQVENHYQTGTDPFNKEGTTLAPGETKMLQVVFGKSFGHVGYALNPAAITGLALYVGAPVATVDRKLLIRSIETFVTEEAQ